MAAPLTKSESTYSEQAEYALLRAQMYRAAASAFEDAPSAETLENLISIAAEAQQSGPDANLDPEQALYAQLRALKTHDLQQARTRIASEYASLFVGPRPPLAPYYESMYLGFPKRLFTATTIDVRTCYEHEGFAVTKKNRVPDDHIAYELEFMASLCEREAMNFREGNAEEALACETSQMNFLEHHLAAWTGPFKDAVKEANCSGYYLAWAEYVHWLATQDLAELETPSFAEQKNQESNKDE